MVVVVMEVVVFVMEVVVAMVVVEVKMKGQGLSGEDGVTQKGYKGVVRVKMR